MKILYVVHQFFPKYYTGTERFVLNLSKQIQRMGHTVKVLTYDFAASENVKDVIHDFFIERYTFQGLPVISIRHKIIPDDLGFDILDKEMEKVVSKLIDEEFDLVHIAHPMRLGSILKIIKQRNIPSVLTLTDFWLMCPRGIAMTITGALCHSPEGGGKCVTDCYGEIWEDRIVQRLNEAHDFMETQGVVVSPTYFLADVLNNQFNREIRVVRHGIEYVDVKPNNRVKQGGDDVVFGYIGTVIPHKGVHIVVEALKLLKNHNIKIKIYGNYFHEQEYYDNLKKMAEGDSRIELLGEYKDEEVPSIMNEIDCLLVPSLWWENSPLTVLTSFAFRVPVITINIGGAAELVKDGLNGFNFEMGNPKSLATTIGKIADNPELLNSLKDNIIRPPRVEEEAFEYEKIYLKLVSDKSQEQESISKDNRRNMPAEDMPVEAAEAANHKSPIVNIRLQNLYLAKYGADFILDIDKRDEMYLFLVQHPDIKEPIAEYFHTGEVMLTSLQDIFVDICLSFDQIDSFLDFACGYGRFTRFLIHKFGREKITVSDIDENAVDFCKKTFGINGFYSVDNPDRLCHDTNYDVIYVASLFSHLSLRLWSGWLKRLYDMLTEGGILIFSTHGMHCYNLLDDETKKRVEKIEEGFCYLTQSETKRLSVKDYGTTYVTHGYLEKVVRQNKLGKMVGFYPNKLWDFQDIYVIQKGGTKTNR